VPPMEQGSAASKEPTGKKPYFLTPEVETVLTISMTIAQELAVARVRIDTLERLLERKGIVARAEIETFEPTPADATQRGQWAQEYIARVLRILRQEAEQIWTGSDSGVTAQRGAKIDPSG
jgi:hypothetical protein